MFSQAPKLKLLNIVLTYTNLLIKSKGLKITDTYRVSTEYWSIK